MALSRYKRSGRASIYGKTIRKSSGACYVIKSAVNKGLIQTQKFVLAEGQRLDVVSANFYGDSRYWCVICAASGIGWQCQVPPGTLLTIPVSLEDINRLIG